MLSEIKNGIIVAKLCKQERSKIARTPYGQNREGVKKKKKHIGFNHIIYMCQFRLFGGKIETVIYTHYIWNRGTPLI